MALFSGGILRSNLHRVVPPGAQGAFVRLSIVFFTRPRGEVVLRKDSAAIAEAAEKNHRETGTNFETRSTAAEWFQQRVKNRRFNYRTVSCSDMEKLPFRRFP
ncbi:hypothetical protein HGRIS_012665 [Hohenbuehelia grisea]|uniref:Isopenicillin N synthase-like Fe(2+) 2OG dioxygenase domain-containing protein n=1 Tax=Hohenbuehelia grisea TaxID=104357 RepID=A0ABR3IT14_9AGAR